MKKNLLIIFLSGFLVACINDKEKHHQEQKNGIAPIFKGLSSNQTHIKFSNTLTESDTLNYFTNPYIYI